MFDLMNIMGKLNTLKEKMGEAKNELNQIKVEGESGAGMVKAIVDGNKKLIKLNIDESLIHINESQMMHDLVIAAVNQAIDKADIASKEHMSELAKKFSPNIPELDISKFI